MTHHNAGAVPVQTGPSVIRPPGGVERPDPRSVQTWANATLAVAVVLFVCAVIGGITLCFYSENVSTSLFTSESDHPYVSEGISLIVTGLLQLLVLGLISQTAKLYAQMSHAQMSREQPLK